MWFYFIIINYFINMKNVYKLQQKQLQALNNENCTQSEISQRKTNKNFDAIDSQIDQKQLASQNDYQIVSKHHVYSNFLNSNIKDLIFGLLLKLFKIILIFVIVIACFLVLYYIKSNNNTQRVHQDKLKMISDIAQKKNIQNQVQKSQTKIIQRSQKIYINIKNQINSQTIIKNQLNINLQSNIKNQQLIASKGQFQNKKIVQNQSNDQNQNIYSKQAKDINHLNRQNNQNQQNKQNQQNQQNKQNKQHNYNKQSNYNQQNRQTGKIQNITTQQKDTIKSIFSENTQIKVQNQKPTKNLLDNKIITNEYNLNSQLFLIKSNKTQSPLRIRNVPREHQPYKTKIDKYNFDVQIQSIVKLITNNNSSIEVRGITNQQFVRGVKSLELVHNVQFGGKVLLDYQLNYNQSDAERKYRNLELLILEQKSYLQKKYQISKYASEQIRFCVFIPSYNNANLRIYMRNLDSVFQQQYYNYHVVYVNDASTDNLGQYVQDYMNDNKIPNEMYTLINNKQNQGLIANTYMAAHQKCQLGEVMILLDGDDALLGTQVLSLLNAVYQKEKYALVYSQFIMVNQNRHIFIGFSNFIDQIILDLGKYRSMKNFVASHLKTMYVDLFRQIKKQDLQDVNGTFYQYSADVCYMNPMIEMAGSRVKFLQQPLYQYRHDTGLNDPIPKQIKVQKQIYTKPVYKKLQQMPFADYPKTISYK